MCVTSGLSRAGDVCAVCSWFGVPGISSSAAPTSAGTRTPLGPAFWLQVLNASLFPGMK